MGLSSLLFIGPTVAATRPSFPYCLCSVVLTADWSWTVNILYLLSTVSYLLEGVGESLVAVKVVMNDICGKKKMKRIKSTLQLLALLTTTP